MTISEFLQKVEDLTSDLDFFKGAIDLTSQQLVEVNRQQLLDGVDNQGEDLPYYQMYTMPDGRRYDQVKQQMNPRSGGRFDMRWTGESFANMRGYFEGNQYRIVTSGEAWGYHTGLYNRETAGKIFGLYENDYMQAYRKKYLYPLLVQLIKARWNL